MSIPANCPHCGTSLQGAPIPDDLRQHYGDATHFQRFIGVEVAGVYDGALFYRCPDCGHPFHRWPEGHELRIKAAPFVELASGAAA